MSGIIPKEQLGDFTRWQINDFAGARQHKAPAKASVAEAPPAEPAAPTPALPSAEEIERIRAEARQAGYQAGLEEGRKAAEIAARNTAQAQAAQFGALLGGLQDALTRLDQEIAEQLLDLGLEIANRMLCASIAARKEVLLPIIREAIAALPVHHAHVNLRLNPGDAAAVRELLGEQLTQTATQIIEDSTISPGGFLVRAGASEVDATIETRWKRVLDAIGTAPRAWLNP